MFKKKSKCEEKIDEEIIRLEGIKGAIEAIQDNLKDAKKACARK